nr:type II toxin-antitoxin system VapB family antitoxin [Halomonas sp. MMSF_3323]
MGKGQAVCLPADIAYERAERLKISRDGDMIILRPVRPSWASFPELQKVDDEFLQERPVIIGNGRKGNNLHPGIS